MINFLHFHNLRLISLPNASPCLALKKQQSERWKLNEKDQDESIEKNLRALDQCCFSSQFYFINSLMGLGSVFSVLATEMMILSQYNMFADPMFGATVLYVYVTVIVGKFA